MSTKSKGKSVPSHPQALSAALKAIRVWESRDETSRAEHARAMRTVLREAAGDRNGDLTLTAVSDVLDAHHELLTESGQPGIDVLDAMSELTNAAHRLSGSFARDVRIPVRVSIDVTVPSPTPQEMKDLQAIIDVEAPNLVTEVFGTIFESAHSFERAEVHEVAIPPLTLRANSNRPLRVLPPLPPIPRYRSSLPDEEAWGLVVSTTSLFVELALLGDRAEEVAVEDADNALAYLRVVGLGEYANRLEEWLAGAV